MGNAHSNNSSELTLAEKRYRIDPSKVIYRQSTKRKVAAAAVRCDINNDQSHGIWSTGEKPPLSNDENHSEQKSEFDDDDSNCAIVTKSVNQNMDKWSYYPSNVSKCSSKLKIKQKSLSLKRTEDEISFGMFNDHRHVMVPVNNINTFLTRTQRILIENSWKRAKKGSETIGVRIFHAILTAQPNIKMLFGLEKLPHGRLKYDNNFRRHCVVLNRTLEYIVANQQYSEKLSQHFRELGKRHCQILNGRILLDIYWETFAECIIRCIVEGETSLNRSRRESAHAWRNLITFIIDEIRRGFDDERLMKKRLKTSVMKSRGSLAHIEFKNYHNIDSDENLLGIQAQSKRSSWASVASDGATDNNRQLMPIDSTNERSASWCASTIPNELSKYMRTMSLIGRKALHMEPRVQSENDFSRPYEGTSHFSLDANIVARGRSEPAFSDSNYLCPDIRISFDNDDGVEEVPKLHEASKPCYSQQRHSFSNFRLPRTSIADQFNGENIGVTMNPNSDFLFIEQPPARRLSHNV